MKVKVCCIGNMEEAELAIRYGADAIGLVSEMPSGPGVIQENRIAEIAASVPESIDTFLLTSLQSADEIIFQHQRCKTTTIQLVDRIGEQAHQIIKQKLPDVKLIQVIHVMDKSSVEKAASIAPLVDALLLDSGNQSLAVKELGGTGRTHNWSISKQIVEEVDIPVYLAGGLKPDNIREATHKVKPYGVDVCSGLRTDGALDEEKVRAFFEQI